MILRNPARAAILGLAFLCLGLLPVVACSGTSSNGGAGSGGSSSTGGATGTGGSAATGGGGGNGGTTGTGGGAAGSKGAGGGGGGGTGGAHDGGTPADGGHDTSSGACWAYADCRSGYFCTVPGQSACGGACAIVSHPCASDLDCPTDAAVPEICVVEPCVCGPTSMGCLAGCSSSADCGPGETCGGNHHCAPIACGAAGQTCPADFICGSAGTCARKPCTSDSQCSNACVEGQCYGSPGHCQIEAP